MINEQFFSTNDLIALKQKRKNKIKSRNNIDLQF